MGAMKTLATDIMIDALEGIPLAEIAFQRGLSIRDIHNALGITCNKRYVHDVLALADIVLKH